MQIDREYTLEELAKHCGSLEQVARVTAMELADGVERGVRCLDFRTGSGFNFVVLPDRGMDIGFAEYKGVNLSWLSGTGMVAPQYFEPREWGWIRGFFGGLLTTCGLQHVGIPDTIDGEHIPAHGRATYLPASHVSYDTMHVADEMHLVARGETREIRPGKSHLHLKRSIHAEAGKKSLTVKDRVRNEGFQTVPSQILYHVNAGFPIVTGGSRMISGSRTVTPRDSDANEAKELFRFCQEPTPNYVEKCYYHDIVPGDDGMCAAAVINPALGDGGLGLYVKYDPRNLPLLTQWKMMGQGMYVMGIEPTNSYGIGVERMKARGLLKTLEPGQETEFRVEIGVLDGRTEIHEFEIQCMKRAPNEPEFASIVI